jgi:mannose/fructose/N-acetylgalactosamine-specific phosphotransferase system component IIC
MLHLQLLAITCFNYANTLSQLFLQYQTSKPLIICTLLGLLSY